MSGALIRGPVIRESGGVTAPEGSPQHAYAETRERWRAAYLDWIARGRPEFLRVEPAPQPMAECVE